MQNMSTKNIDKKKNYDNNGFFQVGIRILRDENNNNFLENLKEAAQNKGISIQKYMILATKEKLDRDGYI